MRDNEKELFRDYLNGSTIAQASGNGTFLALTVFYATAKVSLGESLMGVAEFLLLLFGVLANELAHMEYNTLISSVVIRSVGAIILNGFFVYGYLNSLDMTYFGFLVYTYLVYNVITTKMVNVTIGMYRVELFGDTESGREFIKGHKKRYGRYLSIAGVAGTGFTAIVTNYTDIPLLTLMFIIVIVDSYTIYAEANILYRYVKAK